MLRIWAIGAGPSATNYAGPANVISSLGGLVWEFANTVACSHETFRRGDHFPHHVPRLEIWQQLSPSARFCFSRRP